MFKILLKAIVEWFKSLYWVVVVIFFSISIVLLFYILYFLCNASWVVSQVVHNPGVLSDLIKLYASYEESGGYAEWGSHFWTWGFIKKQYFGVGLCRGCMSDAIGEYDIPLEEVTKLFVKSSLIWGSALLHFLKGLFFLFVIRKVLYYLFKVYKYSFYMVYSNFYYINLIIDFIREFSLFHSVATCYKDALLRGISVSFFNNIKYFNIMSWLVYFVFGYIECFVGFLACLCYIILICLCINPSDLLYVLANLYTWYGLAFLFLLIVGILLIVLYFLLFLYFVSILWLWRVCLICVDLVKILFSLDTLRFIKNFIIKFLISGKVVFISFLYRCLKVIKSFTTFIYYCYTFCSFSNFILLLDFLWSCFINRRFYINKYIKPIGITFIVIYTIIFLNLFL